MDPDAGSSLEHQAVLALRHPSFTFHFIFPFSHTLGLSSLLPHFPAVYPCKACPHQCPPLVFILYLFFYRLHSCLLQYPFPFIWEVVVGVGRRAALHSWPGTVCSRPLPPLWSAVIMVEPPRLAYS